MPEPRSRVVQAIGDIGVGRSRTKRNGAWVADGATRGSAETEIGEFAGRPYYGGMVALGGLPDTDALVVPHGIADLDRDSAAWFLMFVRASDGTTWKMLPEAWAAVDDTNITVTTPDDQTDFEATAYLEYQKT